MGPTPRWDLVANAGGNYRNVKSNNSDSTGGRVAVQATYRITDDPTAARQWAVQLSGQALWLTHSSPGYWIQIKSSLPLFDGVNIPLSFAWANQAGLIQETYVKTSANLKSTIGFTLDVSRLLTSLQPQ
jgi:hypothetical protein